jgi:uncharacterized protein (DUF433 family)
LKTGALAELSELRHHADMSNVTHSDPDIMGGTPVFRGTRVTVWTVFEALAAGMNLDEIMVSWPTLNRDDVVQVIQTAGDEWLKHAA